MKKIIPLIYVATCLFATIGKAQDNPYSTFGYVAQQPNYDITQRELFTIESKDIASEIQKYILDTEGGTLYAIGKKGDIIEKKTIRPDEVLRFLSVDPITRKYPELTPYQFASNTPIQATDLDGLEKIHHWEMQKQKYAGFAKALQLSYDSQLFGQLQLQFATANKGVDIYIIVEKFESATTKGETVFIPIKKVLKDNDKNIKSTLSDINQASKSIDYNGTNGGEDKAQSQAFISFIYEESVKNGHDVVLIKISEELIKEAEKNPDKVVQAAFTIIHEGDFHGLDLKDGKNDKSAEEEHKKKYNDSKIKGDGSPSFENIKKDSEAGKIKETLQNTQNKQNGN